MNRRTLSLALCSVLLLATTAFGQTNQGLYRIDDPYRTLQNGIEATGDGTVLNVQGWGSLTLQVTGITDATVDFEATMDGTTWDALGCSKSNDGSLTSSTTTNGAFVCSIPGYKAIKTPVSAYISGTITVRAVRSTAALGGGGGGGGGGGSITNILDGTGDTIMNSALNAAQVSCVAGCGGSGGTSMADDAAFTPGTTNISPAGFMFDDVTPDSVNEGDGGVARMSANRNIYTTLRDAAGNERGVNVTAGNALTVDASATTQPVSGTVTANAGTNLNTSALLTTSAHDAAFGTAGTADAQVRSVQGIASMTPLQVQSNAANLATETTLASVLTSTNFAAAFGTAGTADTQVMSVQGIASMTPVQVQSNAANLATETTLASALTALQIIDNIVSGAGVNISQINGVTPLMGAGNTGTGSPRVTIATDQAALTNFGARAEDAAHTTGDVGLFTLAVRNDGGSVMCGTTGDYCPFTTDSSGALRVTGGGGGTEYSEDAAAPATIVGTATMIERDDALSTVTPVEGDWISLRGTSIGSLWVRDDNGGTVDSVAGATDRGMPSLAIRDDALTTLVPADGDYTNLRVDSVGSLHVTIDSIASSASSTTVTEDGSIPADAANVTEVAAVLYCDDGTNPVHCAYTAANGLDVDVTRVIPGTTATALGKAVDSASGSTDTGVAMLAIRDDTLSALTPIEGDYVHLRVSSTGALHVTGGGGGTQYNIGDVASATATGTVTLAIRDDSLSTLADAEGDVVGLRVNSVGALHVTGGGGGTEYVVNAAAPADPTGATFTMERDDALSTLTEIEGDWTNPRATAEGALWTQDFNSDAMLSALNSLAGTVGGTELQVDVLTLPTVTIGTFPDNEPFNVAQIAGATAQVATNSLNVAGGAGLLASALVGQCDDTSPTALTENQFGHARINCTTHHQLMEVAAALPTGSNTIGAVTGSGTFTVDSELLAAAALADAAAANPTTSTVGAVPLLMNATTIDRARAVVNGMNSTGTGIAATGVVAQLDDTGTGAVTENQFAPVRLSTRRALLIEGVASGNAVTIAGTVTADAGTNLNTSALLTTSAHDAAFGTAGSADAQVRSVQGIASMTPLQVQSNSANVATETTVASALTALQLIDDDQTGASVHYRTSAGATEDEHEIKATAGRLFSITATNTNAAARYLRCANLTAANTTPGTSTVFLGLAIPGATTGAGFTTNFGPSGIAFSTALTCWLVTGAADSDVAEVAANEIKVIYSYK